MTARETIPQRVEAAINRLREQGSLISRRSICEVSRELDGLPLAETSIQRDPDARRMYMEARSWRPPCRKRPRLPDIDADPRRVSQFLRLPKSGLIKALLLAEAAALHHAYENVALRRKLGLPLPSSPAWADEEEEIAKHLVLLALSTEHHTRYHPTPVAPISTPPLVTRQASDVP